MPKPRTSKPTSAFSVTPWQTKSKKPHDAHEQPSTSPLVQPNTQDEDIDTHAEAPHLDIPHAPAALDQPWTRRPKRKATSAAPHQLQGSPAPSSPVQGAPISMSLGTESPPDHPAPEPPEPPGSENHPPSDPAALASLCEFGEDDVVPSPGPGKPYITSKAAVPPWTRQTAQAPAVPAEQHRPHRLTSLDGYCRLALLPGRAAWTGHCVDSATRTCVGVMAVKVGGASGGGGHTCGMDDDEEIYKVTLIEDLGAKRSREHVTHLVSRGGDLPRWRPADPEQLELLGLSDDTGRGSGEGDGEEEEEEEEDVPDGSRDQGRARRRRGGAKVCMDVTRLLDGDQADAQLAVFAPRLRGKEGVLVVLGEMCVSGLG